MRTAVVGRSAWVGLEIGTARALAQRQPKVDLLPVPAPDERGGLILLAAHTVFPEAGVTILPEVAREEVASGLSGPMRRGFAEYEVRFPTTLQTARQRGRDEHLVRMRDDLLAAMSGSADIDAALDIVGRVHLARAVRGTVPIVIGLACVAWYGAYVQAGSPHSSFFDDAHRLVEQWTCQPLERADIELMMDQVAVGTVGDKPPDLLDTTI